MTALETLIALIAPPEDPAGVPFDWPAIEAALGTPLPSDYKAYCDTYGHGSFQAGWGLWVLTPGTPHEDEDLLGTFYRDLLADHGDAEHRPYPEAGGLLPFVQTELMDGLWWRTGGDPDAWPVLLQDDCDDWQTLEVTATGYIAQFVGGRPRDEQHDIAPPEFHVSRRRDDRTPAEPYVVAGWGHECERYSVDLNLGGAFGESRQTLLDELLAALPDEVRARISDATADRSREVLHVHGERDLAPVREAVQAWANRRAGYTG